MGLSDETPRAWSAIYFFYDPAYAHLSLGTANVVVQIELASLGISMDDVTDRLLALYARL